MSNSSVALLFCHFLKKKLYCIHLISDSSGAVICYDAFIHEIPQVLSGILLDFIEKRGMWSIFDCCIDGSIQPGVFSMEYAENDCFIEQRPLPEDCDIH
jgi:hypothetical protein